MLQIANDLRIKGFRHPVEGDAAVALDDEFLLEPEFFLEILQLPQKVNQLPRNPPEHLQQHQIVLHCSDIAVLDVVKIHDLVLDVEIHLPAQKSAQILVDEIIRSVPRGILIQIPGQQHTLLHRIGRARILQRREEFIKMLHSASYRFEALTQFPAGRKNPLRHHQQRNVPLVLRFEPRLDQRLFFGGERIALLRLPVFKPDLQFPCGVQRNRFLPGRKELPFFIGIGLDVAVFALLRLHHLEVDHQRMIRNSGENPLLMAQRIENLRFRKVERVVVEVLRGLDVILVGIRPMKHHLFAAVGNRIGFCHAPRLARMIARGDEVATLVIPAEEFMEVIIDAFLAAGNRVGCRRSLLRRQKFPPRLAVRIRRFQMAVLIEGILPDGIEQFRLRRLQLGLCALRLRGIKCVLNGVEKIVLDKPGDLPRPGVHDPVKSEIQFRLIQLKELLDLVKQILPQLFRLGHIQKSLFV